jgi:hypothetical protein
MFVWEALLFCLKMAVFKMTSGCSGRELIFFNSSSSIVRQHFSKKIGCFVEKSALAFVFLSPKKIFLRIMLFYECFNSQNLFPFATPEIKF